MCLWNTYPPGSNKVQIKSIGFSVLNFVTYILVGCTRYGRLIDVYKAKCTVFEWSIKIDTEGGAFSSGFVSTFKKTLTFKTPYLLVWFLFTCNCVYEVCLCWKVFNTAWMDAKADIMISVGPLTYLYSLLWLIWGTSWWKILAPPS